MRGYLKTTVLAVVIALLATITPSAASDEVLLESDGLELTAAVEALMANHGFGSADHAISVSALEAIQFSAATIELPVDGDGVAHVTDTGTVINGEILGSDDLVVATSTAFAVVTERHEEVEFRFPISMPNGFTIDEADNGSLSLLDAQSTVVGVMSPAFAIDEAGVEHPASYSFDASASELVMSADLTDAEGSVLVDPSWRCWAKLAGMGLLSLAVVVGWFTSAWWLSYALTAWYGVSPSAARSIALSCT